MKKRNNRTAGNNWERLCMNKLREVFPNVATSRNASREADNAGVDLVRTSSLSFQCKSTVGKLNYHKVLADVQFGIPVVLHKMTKRGDVLFTAEGNFAIMYMEDFVELLKLIQNEQTSAEALGNLLPKHPYKRKSPRVPRQRSDKPKSVKSSIGRATSVKFDSSS